MSVLINHEAISNLQSPLDIEKFGKIYKTETEYFSFPDPNLEAIDKNLFFLLRNSTEILFESKYKFRPDYLSFDQYGTPILWELLMYVNGIFSLEDFDLINVVIPSLDSITSILQDLYSIPEPTNLEEIKW